MIADSRSSCGAIPWLRHSVSVSALSLQSLLLAITAPAELRSSRTGSVRAPATPARERVGPIARIATFFGSVPVTMKPPIRTFWPFSIRTRVEMLTGLVVVTEFGEALAVGEADAVAVGLAFGFGVDAGEAEALGRGLALCKGVGDVLPAVGTTVFRSSAFT